MAVGIGVDIIEVARVEEVIRKRGDRFLDRVFTPGEIAYCRGKKTAAQSFAARFAAKEAAFKEDIAQRVNDAITAAEANGPPEDETLITDVYAHVTDQQKEQLAEVLALEGRGVNEGAFPL